MHVYLVILLFAVEVLGIKFISNEQRLHHQIMQEKQYNKLVPPPAPPNAKVLTVKLGVRLSQILEVSEKNQIVTTKIWLKHEWLDMRLKWDPNDYGGLLYTNIPSDDLWRPDIILYNNADGDFNVTLLTKAKVYHTGLVHWEPPAIYKSYCPINVEFFPFDQQECFMKFSSWTYDGNEIDLRHVREDSGIHINNITIYPKGIDLCEYSQNVEWDIINVTARRKEKFYPCCPGKAYPDITFNITIRRKTLFYTINLIMPIIAISTLTVLVFYLPSDSGEKITLSISILLALTVFFLLLSDINPPTSIVIPLIGKYLLFTMIVVTMSIFLTVYTLSVHFRSPATHEMSPWIKRVFTEILPKALLMKRPPPDSQRTSVQKTAANIVEQYVRITGNDAERVVSPEYENLRQRRAVYRTVLAGYPEEVRSSLKGVTYIAEHLKKGDEDASIKRDWNYVAMVMDRLFLFIFTTAAIFGTIGIFLHAPSIHDPTMPISKDDFNCSK
ncbi:Neuronal acetylcholine receptor subunit [Mactra antiquata]